ncbi:MarR family winged helix-turn-helix transcriptional regulator [Pseudactinotalea sp.]|uniref:MarR family winged helix-turn-helix transcriptional regulator n=1 Tax=Pseudactinotalea sp. TaxID=1926260 RepID=UPI003B3A2FEF
MTSDPTRDPGRWDTLFSLLKQMDSDIEDLYVRRGVEGVRSRFVRPMIRLAHEGPLTIAALAASLEATHSATSQTVQAMKRAGFATSTPGTDGRTQVVSLTEQGADLVPLLEAEWRATEAVVAALDDELDGAVTALSTRLAQALEARPMGQRLDEQLDP